jgi:hypothetical protein
MKKMEQKNGRKLGINTPKIYPSRCLLEKPAPDYKRKHGKPHNVVLI